VIVLDTNVLSEALRPNPFRRVVDWLDSEPAEAMFTTAITEAELLFGAALLPAGRRKAILEPAIVSILAEKFTSRILPFDSAAAPAFANIVAVRRSMGRPILEADARIAAIARSRGAALATRNLRDFTDCGVEPIDPWA
jgi:hypothetical protein